MIKRLYIMPDIWETVTVSQVFNWIALINKDKNINTDCLSISTQFVTDSEVKKISSLINGEFIQIKNKKIFVREITLTIFLFVFYLRNVFKNKKVIFQTRMSSIGIAFLLLKILPKTKFIFEARAATNEEVKHVTKKFTLKKRITYFYSLFNEKIILRVSDKIICVSNALVRYYLNNYRFLKIDKFVVFPGAADDDIFYFNIEKRKKFRKLLKYNKKDIVVVYSGKLDKKWEIPEKIFEFFRSLKSRNPNFKLLMITPDIEISEKYAKQMNFISDVITVKAKLQEVNNYLNAADIGLLLRENVIMNNVASPTKFAEYLLAGLPVIISEGLFDFAKIVNKTKFGSVVKGLDSINDTEYTNMCNSLKTNKVKIAEWGYKHLSKKVFKKEYIHLLKTI